MTWWYVSTEIQYCDKRGANVNDVMCHNIIIKIKVKSTVLAVLSYFFSVSIMRLHLGVTHLLSNIFNSDQFKVIQPGQ